MSRFGFSLRLGLGLLRSRPTLTLLAVLLLTLGVSVLSVIGAARYLLHTAQVEVLAAPTLELELASSDPRIYAEIMSRVEEWPSVTGVSYLSPEQVLSEIQVVAGDSVGAMLGSNPFPPLLRVRCSETNKTKLDSLISVARQWPEVTAVVFPRQVWDDLAKLASKLDRWLWLAALPLLMLTLVLAALCLRAQVRNRATTWEFLSLLGLSRSSISMALLTQQIIIGILAGLFTASVVWGATYAFQWLLLRDLALPPLFLLAAISSPILLALLAGLASRPMRQ